MIRQLMPTTHLDTNPKVLRYLVPHLPRVIYVGEHERAIDIADSSGKRIFSVHSLVDYSSHFLRADGVDK